MKCFSYQNEVWEVKDSTIYPGWGIGSGEVCPKPGIGSITFYCKSNPKIGPITGHISISGPTDTADLQESDLIASLKDALAEQERK